MPKLTLTKPINFKEKFACFMSFAFALHSSIEITYHEFAVNFHCMLFGRVAEKERIFTEGLIPLCFVYMFTQYALVIFGSYLFHQSQKYPKFNWTYSTKTKNLWKGLFFYLICLHLLFFKGFHYLCGTLDAPVCSNDSTRHIEFKYFQPKYIDGTHFYAQYMRMSISSCFNVACLIYFYYSNLKKIDSSTNS